MTFSRPSSRVADGDAGWSSPVARQAHNLKVVGSNPTPATNKRPRQMPGPFCRFRRSQLRLGLRQRNWRRRSASDRVAPQFCIRATIAMSAFLFTFLACALAGIGARDQVLVARLVERLGERPALLLVAVLTGAMASAAAAWGAWHIAETMPMPARILLAAVALAVAGAEGLFLRLPRPPREPTRSLGAAALVLLAGQLTDSSRFLIFAIAVATTSPGPVGVGGTLGGAAALAIGWASGGRLFGTWVGRFRRVIGALLIAIALWLALQLR